MLSVVRACRQSMTHLVAHLGGTLSKTRWWLLFILIIAAPFHAFLITWLKDAVPETGLITAISAWREIFVVLISIIVALEILLYYKLRLDWLDWLIIAYALLGMVFFFFQENKMQWLWGMRFNIMPFLFYVFVRHVHWEKRGRLIIAALISGAVVVILGLLHALVLPQNFLTNFGYSTYQGQFQPDIALSACQYLEHTERFCRAISTFGGPTRYGTYLLLLAGLLLPFLVHKTRGLVAATVLFALTLVSIVLTYSRSIWIGTGVAALVGFFAFIPRKVKWKIFLAGIVLFLLGIFGWKLLGIWDGKPHEFPPPILKTIFVRESSTNEHWLLMKDAWETSLEKPLGIGLGATGPASVRFSKFLTENWYLQISVEMGIVGGLLFVFFLIGLLRKLFLAHRNWSRRGLFLSLLAISVAGLFTHSFEEITTILLLMAFAGIFLSPPQSGKRHA
ncbi:O-antigen ligase family protein [Candidatus Peregrinibacteria bacterium]|nr:O-antigen ligase family protein [Candidatus Peregrinibacteria bacterium]